MTEIQFPYGKKKLSHVFEDTALAGVFTSGIEEYTPAGTPEQLVERALSTPFGGVTLEQMASKTKTVVIIASDHTRPVPSKVIIPQMLQRIRRGNPDAQITILIATGCHRETSRQELIDKFGEEIVEQEQILVHDCDCVERLVNIGTLPSGGVCQINATALEADLLVAEGFIEPHFFAGFSGGRKSVLPGIAGRSTVLANHCAEFIDSPYARTGVLENNPIHRDMLWAAKKAGLRFIVNVVLNGEKQVIHAVAGEPECAHREGVSFLSSLCAVDAVEADVAITTNGGYPLDQNLYQAVKGMTAAEATVKKGGVIIMLAQSGDGIGGEHFYHQLADEPDISKTMALFHSRSRQETVPDQWQSQVLLRVLQHATVIYISDLDDAIVRQMHMLPAHSIGEALKMAAGILGKKDMQIVAIPDGVSVIVRKKDNAQ